MKKGILIALAVLFIMPMLAIAGETIKDPSFDQARRKGYACKSPLGRDLRCNVWHFEADRGFLRRCDHTNLFETPVNPVFPDRKCVAAYDSLRADLRNFDHIDFTVETAEYDPYEEMMAEFARPVRRAMFWQYVQVKKSGMYDFKACMSGEFFDHPDYVYKHSGIIATLEHWDGSGTGGQKMAQLPEKEMVLAENSWYLDSGRDLIPVDAYEGHAGLTSEYYLGFTAEPGFEAEYTCHKTRLHLNKGFYVARGEVPQAFRFDDDLGLISDYDGYGVITHMSLRKTR